MDVDELLWMAIGGSLVAFTVAFGIGANDAANGTKRMGTEMVLRR